MMRLHFPSPRHTKTQYVRFDVSLCQACWSCVENCPQHVLGKVHLFHHQHVHVDRARQCKGCRKCMRVCPNQAIQPIPKAARTT
jgi:2-oxoglutarate ferredoxin oxidoreductase subunit delta